MATIGVCKLCNLRRDLQESHVWPKFLYKKYVADQSKGGSFWDLRTLRDSPKQCRRPWFCQECEQCLSVIEKYAAEFFGDLEKHPNDPIDYDERLLKFAVSISWRSAMFFVEDDAIRGDDLRKACRHWKDYLIGKESPALPFSQHAFILLDQKSRPREISGKIFSKEGVVCTRVGPLILFGLLSRKSLTLAEVRILETSQIRQEGGPMRQIMKWQVGTDITNTFAQCGRDLEDSVNNLKDKLPSKPRGVMPTTLR